MRLPRIEALQLSADPNAISRTKDGWRLKSAVQYGYAAIVPFDGFGAPGISGVVDVRLRVTAGRFVVGVITGSDQVIQEQTFEVFDSVQQAAFNIGTSEFKSIVFRSVAPNGTVSEALVQSVDYVVRANPVPSAVYFQQASIVDPTAALDPGPPLRVTAGQPYGYAATIPLSVRSLGKSVAFVKIHGKVIRGRMGLGIINKSNAAVVGEHFYDATPNTTDYVVAIPSPGDAGRLVIRSDQGEKSEIAIENVAVFRIM
jgi:hypothetical protein